MASDASDFAVASYSIEGLPEFSFSAELTLEERGELSSIRELLAIQRTLQHWAGSDTMARALEPVTLWWLTDNQDVEKMLAKGSGKLRIMKLVLDILKRGRSLLLDYQSTILDWRAALPMALYFQQLLRGAECFGLTGANVTRHFHYFMVEVAEAKNNPEGFSFKVPIDPLRTHCMGQFMADYVVKMGVILGDPASFFACKVAKVRGIKRATASVKASNSTMRAGCKRLIKAVGLDSTRYASHSCKRGAALTAMEAGLSHVQIQDLGRWASSSMVLKYAGGDSTARQTAAEAVRI
jgi:hypothetical protein